IPKIIPTKELRNDLKIDLNAKVIALLPGSRLGEIKQMGKLFLQTALLCFHQNPSLKFVAPLVNETCFTEFLKQSAILPKNFPLQLFLNNSQQVIAASDAVLVASGTATLETALLQKPMVVTYRLSWLNHQIAKLLINIPYFSLPNLLLNKTVVP